MKKYLLLFLIIVIPLIPAEKSGREEIFENQLWKQIYGEYNPDPGTIESLKSKIAGISSIDVYFAFWCGDSENNVPPFMKILDEMGGERIGVNYFKVERKTPGEKYYYEKLKVKRVPTFIFFESGYLHISVPNRVVKSKYFTVVFV